MMNVELGKMMEVMNEVYSKMKELDTIDSFIPVIFTMIDYWEADHPGNGDEINRVLGNAVNMRKSVMDECGAINDTSLF